MALRRILTGGKDFDDLLPISQRSILIQLDDATYKALDRVAPATKRQRTEFIRQAESNLQDSPEVWNQVAREENLGNVALIDTTLRADCPPGERMRYDQAAAGAIAALNAFNHWLEDNLAERLSDWRLGKERYAKKFRLVLATGKTPEALLAEAEADLAKTRAEIARLAAPKSVEQALADVARQHATAANYMPSAKQALAAATAFVKSKDLLTLPPNANLEVIETPVFMRGVYGVGGFNPAPALEPTLGAFFWVTPIPSTWPQARIDSKLREYNSSGMQHLTVHEAMPGHYVQGEYANEVQPRSRRLLRNIFGNGPYIEGWAVYSQQLMAEQGYLDDTPGYRLTLQKQLLRVLANTILDVRLQTLGMTDQQALDLMTQSTYQETEEATAKLQRAKLSSCQFFAYDSMTRPTAESCLPGFTALIARMVASWVRSTRRRCSSDTSPAKKVALVSPCTPSM